MSELLEDTLARAEQVRTELQEILDQLRGELGAVKSATVEAHEAIQDLRTVIHQAKEEMRQSGKAEARKHLARQMRAAADVLARDS
jgi:predicted  nucleic acid-binding Zn-ribbon protein